MSAVTDRETRNGTLLMTTILITGTNRGIGLELARHALAKQLGDSLLLASNPK